MSDTARHGMRDKNMGDTAVDGLLAGILAGLGMAAYLILSGLLSGTSPAIILGRFDPTMDGGWLVGSAAHLAVSGIYGAVFALLFALAVRWRGSFLRYGWLLGLLYGLALVALARGVLLPAAGSAMLEIEGVQLVIAHAVYGLVLGFVVSRKW